MINLQPERSNFDKWLDHAREWFGGLLESGYMTLTSKGINSKGGSITVRNARVWTGDSARPWSDSITIRDGVIVSIGGEETAGKIVDAGGRLLIPGLADGHCHPQVPFTLSSPEAPMLFKAKSVADVQAILRRYLENYPTDKYPRLFGWMSAILPPGENPTRQMLDEIVNDRPCYVVHHSGHEFWANTKALEVAGILESDPDWLPEAAVVHRDPETGLATGYTEESEFGGSDGVMLRSVKRVGPLNEATEQVALRTVLEMYAPVGVTSIWTKDGDLATTDLYQALLERDSLPVRAVLDHLYCPLNEFGDIAKFADRAKALADSGLPAGFLRADGIKLMFDIVSETHQAWLFQPYADGIGGTGKPVFPIEELCAQAVEADRLGLQINTLAIGDRAVHESLNAFEHVARTNPPRPRRFCVEHAEYVSDLDVDRFKALDAIPVFNPIGMYPDAEYQAKMARLIGRQRLNGFFQPWRALNDAGAVIVNGSDFPLAPMDPLVGMHLLCTGTDIDGAPEGGLFPDKQIDIESALRSYTTNFAYAAHAEDRIGSLREGHAGDIAVLSDDILAEDFDLRGLGRVKVNLTIFNGHTVHEDFSADEKVIDFGE